MKPYTIERDHNFPKTPHFNCGSSSINQYAEHGVSWDRARGYHTDIHFVAYNNNKNVIGLCTLVLYYDISVQEFLASYIAEADIYEGHIHIAHDRLDLHETRIGYLEAVAVDIEWQGKGVGKALYDLCEKEGLAYIFLKPDTEETSEFLWEGKAGYQRCIFYQRQFHEIESTPALLHKALL